MLSVYGDTDRRVVERHGETAPFLGRFVNSEFNVMGAKYLPVPATRGAP
jgi:hypothetical protein